jgi:hypothetical protein
MARLKNSPHKCAWCGKRYGSRDTEWIQIKCDAGDYPAPPTNKVVIKRGSPYRTLDGLMAHSFLLWDGESFHTPYKPFCTLRCGLAYARSAYEKQL